MPRSFSIAPTTPLSRTYPTYSGNTKLARQQYSIVFGGSHVMHTYVPTMHLLKISDRLLAGQVLVKENEEINYSFSC